MKPVATAGVACEQATLPGMEGDHDAACTGIAAQNDTRRLEVRASSKHDDKDEVAEEAVPVPEVENLDDKPAEKSSR